METRGAVERESSSNGQTGQSAQVGTSGSAGVTGASAGRRATQLRGMRGYDLQMKALEPNGQAGFDAASARLQPDVSPNAGGSDHAQVQRLAPPDSQPGVTIAGVTITAQATGTTFATLEKALGTSRVRGARAAAAKGATALLSVLTPYLPAAALNLPATQEIVQAYCSWAATQPAIEAEQKPSGGGSASTHTEGSPKASEHIEAGVSAVTSGTTTASGGGGETLSKDPQINGKVATGYQGVGVFKVSVDQPFRDKVGKAKSGTIKAGQKVQVVAGAASNQYGKIVSVSGEPTIVDADDVWITLKSLVVDSDTATDPGAGKTGAGVQVPAAIADKLPQGRNPGKSAYSMTFKAGVSFFDDDCAIAPDTMGRIMRLVQWAISEDMINGNIVISDAARSRKRAHTYTVCHRIQTGNSTTIDNIMTRAKASNGAENVADLDRNNYWLKEWGIDPNVDPVGAKAKLVERSLQIRTQSKPAAEGYKSSEFADRRWPNASGEDISKHCSGKAVDLDIPWKSSDGSTDLWGWEEILNFFGLARTVSSESWHVEPKGEGIAGNDAGKQGGEDAAASP